MLILLAGIVYCIHIIYFEIVCNNAIYDPAVLKI